jgi:hypothetical protein
LLQERYDKHVEETKGKLAAEQAAHIRVLANLQGLLAEKNKQYNELKRLQRLTLKIPSMRAQAERPSFGGQTRQTRLKLAKKLEAFLCAKFANQDARRHALYEHSLRHPTDYNAILNQGMTLGAFEEICRLHPEWLTPIQQDVINRIEEQWTRAKCLSIQIHCKVGAQEKYQHLINLLAKEFDEETKKWENIEILPGVKMPKLCSKNVVSAFRDEIVAENPLIQDESGTACWLDLRSLVKEVLVDDRERGYLQCYDCAWLSLTALSTVTCNLWL